MERGGQRHWTLHIQRLLTSFQCRNRQKNAPPIFLVCASDDGFGLADDSIELYKLWHQLGINAELHMFARGYHGFGMKKSGQPKDKWIERFYEWALNENFIVDTTD